MHKKSVVFYQTSLGPPPLPPGFVLFFRKGKILSCFWSLCHIMLFLALYKTKKGVGFILGDSPLWFGEGPQFSPLFCAPILHPLTPGSGTAILSLHPLTDCFHISYPINGFPHQVQSSLGLIQNGRNVYSFDKIRKVHK